MTATLEQLRHLIQTPSGGHLHSNLPKLAIKTETVV